MAIGTRAGMVQWFTWGMLRATPVPKAVATPGSIVTTGHFEMVSATCMFNTFKPGMPCGVQAAVATHPSQPLAASGSFDGTVRCAAKAVSQQATGNDMTLTSAGFGFWMMQSVLN